MKLKKSLKLENRISQMREEVEGLLELNNKLIKKQEFKDKELLTYRKKLKSQREEIKVGE